jgi:hypothetical protein
MTEPANDMSLLETLPVVVYPLRELVEPSLFIEFRANPRRWEISSLVDLELPGVRFRRCRGELWESRPGRLRFWPGHSWDGSSGPAADTPDAWIPSLFHDCACTYLAGEAVLPGYWLRHWLYSRMLLAQRPRPRPRKGCGKILDAGRVGWCYTRAGLDFVGLVAGNWPQVIRGKWEGMAHDDTTPGGT